MTVHCQSIVVGGGLDLAVVVVVGMDNVGMDVVATSSTVGRHGIYVEDNYYLDDSGMGVVAVMMSDRCISLCYSYQLLE